MQPIETESMERLDSPDVPHPAGWQSYNSIVDTVMEQTWIILRMPHWLKNEVLAYTVYITDAEGTVVWSKNGELGTGVHFYQFPMLPSGHQAQMVQVDYKDTPKKRLGLVPQVRRLRIA